MNPKCAGCHSLPDIGNGLSTLTSGSSGWHLVQTRVTSPDALAKSESALTWWCPRCWRKRRASLRASA